MTKTHKKPSENFYSDRNETMFYLLIGVLFLLMSYRYSKKLMFTWTLFRDRYVMHENLLKLSRTRRSDSKHVNFSGIGLNACLVTDASLTKQVTIFPEYTKIKVTHFDALLGEGTGTTNSYENWKLRLKCQKVMYKNISQKFVNNPDLDRLNQELVHKLTDYHEDIVPIMKWYTSNVTLKLLLNWDQELDAETLKLLVEGFSEVKQYFLDTIIRDPIPIQFPNFITGKSQHESRIKAIDDFVEKIYQHNKVNNTEFYQILSKHLTPPEIFEEIKGTLFPGSEHAVPISFILYELAKSPIYQQPDVDGTYSDDYLNKIITEGLRMYPQYPILARTNKNKSTKYEYRGKECSIDPNVEIYTCPYVAGRNNKEYSNPDLFDPHRPNHSEYAFGWGNRTCPARTYIKWELRQLFRTILENFKLSTNEATPKSKSIITIENVDPIQIGFERI